MTNVLQQAKQNKDSFLMDVLQQNTTIMSEVRKFGKPQLKKEGVLSRLVSGAWLLWSNCTKQLLGMD